MFQKVINKINEIKNLIKPEEPVLEEIKTPVRITYNGKDYHVASNLEFFFENEDTWLICKNKMRWHLKSKTKKVIKIDKKELFYLIKDIKNLPTLFLIQDLRGCELDYNFLVETSIYTETCREIMKRQLM